MPAALLLRCRPRAVVEQLEEEAGPGDAFADVRYKGRRSGGETTAKKKQLKWRTSVSLPSKNQHATRAHDNPVAYETHFFFEHKPG
jgi:hypothetical protein